MEQSKNLRRHIIALCKQIAWNYRSDVGENAAYWTDAHRQWLREKTRNAPESIKMNMTILLSQLDSLEEHIDDYAKKVEKIASTQKYKRRVQALICYRGISILSAMVIISELGNIRRFPHPKKIVSYIGMDISEYSSGGKERRFAMTKMGNRHLRRILTEAVQSANKIPVLSKELKKRRVDASMQEKAIADRCMKRLYTKATNLHYKSKPINKIKSACAREMVGYYMGVIKFSNNIKFIVRWDFQCTIRRLIAQNWQPT